MSRAHLRAWRFTPRSAFPYRVRLATFASMNDCYGHLNNSNYYFFLDTAIDWYLARRCGLLVVPDMKEMYAANAPLVEVPSSSALVACGGGGGGGDVKTTTDILAFCAENSMNYLRSTKAPCTIECGVAVTHLGNSSATFHCGFFPAAASGKLKTAAELDAQDKADGMFALGRYVHVFVDRETEKPVRRMPDHLRDALERIRIDEPQ